MIRQNESNSISKLIWVTLICGLAEIVCIISGIMFQRYYISEYMKADKMYSTSIQSTEYILTYLYAYENATLLSDEDMRKNTLQIMQSEISNIQSMDVLKTEQEKTICKNAVASLKTIRNDSVGVDKAVETTRSEIGLLLTYLKEDKQETQKNVKKLNTYSFLFDCLAIIGTVISVIMCIYLVQKNSRQIFEKKELEGYTDGLTKIFNRKYVDERLSAKINTGNVGYLYMFDMDNFKKVNDTFGHEAGDEVLKGFAGILRNILRTDDIPCRLGGDEYMVFADVQTDENAERLAMRIINATLEYFEGTNGNVITLSCGIAKADGSLSFDEVYKMADDALYKTKNNGKNGYSIYGKEKTI